MELPVRAAKASQGGLFWKALGWYCISTAAQDTYTPGLHLSVSFLQRNKTLVKSETDQLWAKAGYMGKIRTFASKVQS